MSSYQVRPATVRDAKVIAEINAAASRAAYQGLVPDEQLGTLPVDKRQQFWRDAIEYMEPQVQVATEGDKVIGFVGFDRSRDAGTPSTCGEIWAIYVEPSHWNKGVGLALWDAANDGLKEEGCTKVTAWVPVRNERALRFHEHAGFKREMSSLKTVLVGSVKLEEIRLKRDVG
ncbi:MAG: GNAT family N-acetyltransferase [Polaromonas sp.]|nr:GNAT family N-acetyltransferase [Polaromonas sp.]MDP3172117.1 GNAT family N-acetyltransferase [Polaromonas sp.]MDP3413305.1 GNAT family N-acetyltransferase [Polaromonas sp.]